MTRRHTFPPEARLHSAADFAAMRRCRRPLSGRFFVVRHVPGEATIARLGLAVSRKTSKRAVVRNRIKRCVRESFRLVRHTLPRADLLVIARAHAAEASNALLRQELARHWAELQRYYRHDPQSGGDDPSAHHHAGADGQANPT